MMIDSNVEATAQTPCGINHLVLNVRNIEESHHFWSELLGFRHVATSKRVDGSDRPPMRFYNGARNGGARHHDIALLEEPALAVDPGNKVQSMHHIAIEYATFEMWQRQKNYLISCGVKLYRHLERGVSHSIHLDDPNGYQIELVCDLPRSAWENDIEAALNQRPVVHAIAEMRDE